jgi:DNA-binding NtrC family response regulator
MARVVVLDSCSDTADRVRQALQADAAQQPTRVEVATNQSQALRLLQSQETTALLTDLLAANGDAIGFLSQVCQQSPPVPVIMLTSAANEDLAVQALRTGATSYVPKRLLEEELYETVQSVLALASHHRSRLRVLECMEHWSAEFTLENDRFLIPPLSATCKMRPTTCTWSLTTPHGCVWESPSRSRC